MKLPLLASYTALSILVSSGAAANAIDTKQSGAPNSVPGFQWTQIQDLKADARAENRPIKQKWAVVIGASKFKEHRLDQADASMDRAAHEFYNYLIDEKGGRFAPSHVKLLTNAEATRQGIMAALGSQWLGQLAGPDDLVTVFIATNSFPTTDGSTYLCAYDCALDNIYSTCISIPDLMGTLKKEVKSDRILLVLQAAYSGAAELNSGSKALYSGYNIDVDKVQLGKGYVILSSSGPNEQTWNDAFSHQLVTALRQQNGLIPLRDAFATAQKNTQAETSKLGFNRRQTPVMKADWSGNDLVLGTPPIEKVSDLPPGVTSFLSAEVSYLAATKLANASKFDEAIAEYQKAIGIDPKYADALADYGAVMAIKNNLPEAVSLYEKAVAVRPNDTLFHANYARILDRMGKAQEATAQLEKAYLCNPKDLVVLQALAGKDLKSGNVDRAVKLLKEAVTLYPKSSTVHERLSYAYSKSGEGELALNEAREAAKLDPKSPSAQLNLGSTLLMSGNRADAIEAYRSAVTIAPDYSDAHYLLSRALEASGDKPAAVAELNRFLQLCQDTDPRAAAARKHLSELDGQSSASATSANTP